MPYPKDITYPAIATNASWQKKKSTLDKGIKTKVGPALLLAEAKWKAIDFVHLKDQGIIRSVHLAEQALTKAKQAMVGVNDARDALQAAAKLAKTQAANTKLNKTSRAALTDIVKALLAADKRLADMDDIVPAMQVDVNNANAAALNTLTRLEVKLGKVVLANARQADLQSNKTYEATGVQWKVRTRDLLDYLQKKVDVTGFDGAGRRFSKEMTIAGVRGDDMLRLK